MLIGFFLDWFLGDPQTAWHPVACLGRLIARLEKALRPLFSKTPRGERIAGTLLCLLVLLAGTGLPALLLWAAYRVSPWLFLPVDGVLCFFLLAVTSLRRESLSVYDALAKGDLPLARRRVARIVGRDTGALDASQVASAAVETVAESTVDGIVAPLFYIALGASPLGFFHKAASTMDSMIGYRTDAYRHFGTAAARLDDALNFLPARIGGVLMCVAAALCGEDARGAFHIFKRDRKNHASPNSAHCEAACAGALGLTLGGDASYFGIIHHKPTQGSGRRAAADDIVRACRLSRATALLALGFALVIRLALLWAVF